MPPMKLLQPTRNLKTFSSLLSMTTTGGHWICPTTGQLKAHSAIHLRIIPVCYHGKESDGTGNILLVSDNDKGKRIYVDFDGAMANAKVWLNGKYVGEWPYGYTSFRLDLTPYIITGKENIIAVRLDTKNWDSRWYPGAGLYRNVWLVKTSQLHIANNGVFCTTPEIKKREACLVYRLKLKAI